jgi:hypothetical protein
MSKLGVFFILIATSVAALSQTGGATGTQTTFPRVVKTFSICNLTDPLPTTTVFTPAKTGIYRVTLMVVVTQGNGQSYSAWTALLGWDNGYQGSGPLGWDIGVKGTGSTSVAFTDRLMLNKPVTISSSSTGDVSGTTYLVRVIIEQLM